MNKSILKYIVSVVFILPTVSATTSFAGLAGTPCAKFRGTSLKNTGVSQNAAIQSPVVRWKFPTGAGIYSSPVIGVDGTIYFGSKDHKIYAVKKRWKY